jgi:hypothetical protein
MQCFQCASDAFTRSHPRGAFENLLFVWGAEILRCLRCSSRGAFFGNFTVRLSAGDGVPSSKGSGIKALVAIVGGVLACAVVALWTLRHFHRF